MTDYDAIDFFRGDELVTEPHPYFEWLRAQCPVQREHHHNVMMVRKRSNIPPTSRSSAPTRGATSRSASARSCWP
jgi:hypothetical protein